MNNKMRISAINLVFLAALTGLLPVFAESSVSENLNNPTLSDNLSNTERLIARWTYIRDLTLNRLRTIAPAEARQVDSCLEAIKQLSEQTERTFEQPLISPLQSWKFER
ncbi:MAG: hypothetical protein K2X29_08905 [Candidatus Obscuribacterales bacterium]|nr:hypothetical protein [Candidatus Obscuribacterales bacterium]